mmetsp:Transcript_32131/g.68802  ORF Transcript_32131/g.68802 Transcript_32131/m.68802 type:complete len:307 (-) Transcript_32131:715-1635(-)
MPCAAMAARPRINLFAVNLAVFAVLVTISSSTTCAMLVATDEAMPGTSAKAKARHVAMSSNVGEGGSSKGLARAAQYARFARSQIPGTRRNKKAIRLAKVMNNATVIATAWTVPTRRALKCSTTPTCCTTLRKRRLVVSQPKKQCNFSQERSNLSLPLFLRRLKIPLKVELAKVPHTISNRMPPPMAAVMPTTHRTICAVSLLDPSSSKCSFEPDSQTMSKATSSKRSGIVVVNQIPRSCKVCSFKMKSSSASAPTQPMFVTTPAMIALTTCKFHTCMNAFNCLNKAAVRSHRKFPLGMSMSIGVS